MKYTLLTLLFASVLLSSKAQNTVNDFKIIEKSGLQNIASKQFTYTSLTKDRFDCELQTHEIIENDTTTFMLFSLRKNKLSKSSVDIPSSDDIYCQFDSTEVSIRNYEERLSFTDALFVNKAFNTNLKKLIETSNNGSSNKKVYFFVLDAFSFDKFLSPKKCSSVQDAVLKWKMIGETRRGTYIYCIGTYEKGLVKTDKRDCLLYPHDNLLKGKITWRKETTWDAK